MLGFSLFDCVCVRVWVLKSGEIEIKFLFCFWALTLKEKMAFLEQQQFGIVAWWMCRKAMGLLCETQTVWPVRFLILMQPYLKKQKTKQTQLNRIN